MELYAEKVQQRGLSAVAQCESLRYKLLAGLAVRRYQPFPLSELCRLITSACYGVLRFIMESGAKGCEVVVSGKLRAARAKSMKFTDGFMIHSGQPVHNPLSHSSLVNVMIRSAISSILQLVMYSFVKVFSELKSRFSLMNFLVGRARNLFLILFLLLNQKRLMLKVSVNHEALMLIPVQPIKLLPLPSHKHLNSKVDFNKVDFRKEGISRKFISSPCRE